MAKASKDAYYFSHDSNAYSDPKILKLRMAFGWEGYGIFWAIIENLRNQENYTLAEDDFDFLTLSLAIDEAKLKQILSKCLAIGLLVLEDGNIFSRSLLQRMDKRQEIREKRKIAGAKGGRVSKPQANSKQNASKREAGKESKGKESKGNKSKVNKDIKICADSPQPPKKTISQRGDDFVDGCKNIWNEAGGASYLASGEFIKFTEYWTESSVNGTKMRFEKEKVFDSRRRFSTWVKNINERSFGSRTKKPAFTLIDDSPGTVAF